VKGISVLFAPMMILLDVTTNGSLRLLGLKTEAEDDAASEEDIRLMVENSGEQGAIAQEEQQWIENVFDFGDMVASDAMTPEPDVTAFPVDEDADEILQAIKTTGLSRYPVYEDDINDIIGILNARD
ncbi:HlyC/CorC family transporter, partial [Escherichia coli]|nr:HlyC/CorC family transporter [Escherichia coli]